MRCAYQYVSIFLVDCDNRNIIEHNNLPGDASGDLIFSSLSSVQGTELKESRKMRAVATGVEVKKYR